ncbi:hypothetical protein [Amycolatopsis sp. NPDC051128]|uniref:hypothetical protein n=1 Tax=Amycolatopsis sp. NPDC051128 TaxID=3155412 RepID=UPI00342D82B6
MSGQTVSYDHSLGLHTTSCNSCLEAHADRATWLELDPRISHPPPDDRAGLIVRARPPSQPAAIGDIVIELHGQSVGILGVAVCGTDQRGLITRIEVNPAYRLRRFGTALVLAALNHRPATAGPPPRRVGHPRSGRVVASPGQVRQVISLGGVAPDAAIARGPQERQERRDVACIALLRQLRALSHLRRAEELVQLDVELERRRQQVRHTLD